MYVRRLELVDFRSYPRVVVEFQPGVTVLVGRNGTGKTNLLEALSYVATLASHRVATDAPLVRTGTTSAVVRAEIVHDGRSLSVEIAIEPGRANRARLNGAPVRRPREVLGALRLVLFAPEDLALVRGDPAGRRRYLDDLLVSRQPRYAAVRADFERVLKQRNALLRTAYLARRAGSAAGSGIGSGAGAGAAGARDLSTLDAWDAHLAAHGAALLAGRLELVGALGPHIAKAYDAVSAAPGEAAIAYQGGVEVAPAADRETPDREALEAALAQALADARTAEIDRGVTLVGPHRDDLLLTLGELPARGYASHGESWSLALALRLAGYDLLRAEGVEPVLALDDVFAELDAGRRDRLAALVAGASQVLVTCAVPADVPQAFGGERYEVAEGEVRHAG